VAGYTYSSNLPVTAGAYQTTYSGNEDAFVAKVNPAGTGLVYSTYLGSNYTTASAIALDSSGNAYMTLSGGTVPVTTGAYSSCCGTYLTKLNATGSALVYSARFGNNLSGVAVDGSGNAYLTGYSYDSSPGTPGAYQTVVAGGTDAVITKLNPVGAALVYSTYLGANGGDQGFGVAVDSAGNAYVTGQAGSLDFPITTEAAKSATGPYTQVFVTKLNSSGSTLAYSTFVGGTGTDAGNAIAVDAGGNAYVTGQTTSNDFPVTQSAAQTTPGGAQDAFLFKLSPAGTLTYSTYIGGSSNDYGTGVAVDSSGNAYVAGSTNSPDFRASGRIGNVPGGMDVFVTKVNRAGSAFLYSTLLGGSNNDYATGIAIDAAGSAYLTGYTSSSDFPVTNGAYQMLLGGSYDAFVAKLNQSGSGLTYATYLGGSNYDYGYAIAVDAAGSAYVTGSTQSTDFPVSTAFQNVLEGSPNAFVTKLNPSGTALAYSTYLGGSNSDYGYGIAVDAAGSAYVTGSTSSPNFPVTQGAVQATWPGYYYYNTAFVTKLYPSGSTLQYSTYLGGSNSDQGRAIAVGSGYVVVAGSTMSTDFTGASLGFQKTLANGAQNVFVAKISDPAAGCLYAVSPTSFSFGGSGGSGTVNVTAPAGCPWIAVPSNNYYLRLQFSQPAAGGITGSGNGSVTFTVSSDTYTYDSGGTAQFTVAGQIVTVTQTAPCALSMSPAAAFVTNAGATLNSLTVSSNGCYWGNVFTTTPWIDITNNNSNSGNGTIQYRVLPNPQGTSRMGTIYVGPNVFTVTQNGAGNPVAVMVSPVPSLPLPGQVVIFCWTPAVTATAYWLDVGTKVGSGNLFAISTTNTCVTVPKLPTDGSNIYVQLYTQFAGVWQTPLQYTYTAATITPATLIAPAPVTPYSQLPSPTVPTTQLSGTTVAFYWSPGVGADLYWLDVGTAFAQGNIFAGSLTSTFQTVGGIPCDGSSIHVQIWSHINGQYQPPRQFIYKACTAASPTMTDPTPGSALPNAPVVFKWTNAPGADSYRIYVGSTSGAGDLYSAVTSVPTAKMPALSTCDGRTIYVQLSGHVSGTWQTPNLYTYAACKDQRARLISPPINSTLSGSTVTFTWSASGDSTVSGYWLDVGNAVGRGDISAGMLSSTTTSKTVTGLPVDGRTIYVRLWTQTAGTWQPPIDYTFNAFNDRGRMLTPAPGSQVSSATTFCWSPATPSADYWLDVGTSQGVGDISSGVVTATCKTVTAIPGGNKPIWVRLWTRIPATTGTYLTPIDYTYTGPQ
jgi:hypothetical protein